MNEIEFKCKIKRLRYKSDNYKIYVVESGDNLKTNKSDEIILVGDIMDLLPNQLYNVKANIEINKKFGIQYKAIEVKQEKPTDINSAQTFLSEVATPNQAEILLSVYPNIIDKVINNDLKDIDLSKTKGIKELTFNKIKEAIIKNFALLDVVALFKNYISINTVKRMYDKYHSVEKITKMLNLSPYKCLCEISGIGFKSADSILMQLEKMSKEEESKIKFSEDLTTSYQRMSSCIDYILTENEKNGNTRLSIKDVREECYKLTPQCIDKFVDVIKMNKNSIYVDNESKTIARKITYESELFIADTINKALLNINNEWDIPYELYRKDENITLTDEQMGVLKNCCKYNISILTAPAGSGKSQSIKNVITMLEDNNKSYLLCTPTGKSSEVLADYCNREAGTIHRQYKYNPSNEQPWGYNKTNKLDIDTLLVDESGMIDVFLMKHLLEGIDINKTKIIFVFDSYQLASVSCGNVAHDLLTSNIIPTTYLTKIFRYNEGGLMQIATKIRNSESFLPNDFTGAKIFGTQKDFIFNEIQQDKIIHQVVAVYKKLISKDYSMQDIMVLSAQNKGNYGTKIINKAIQLLIQNNNNNNFLMRGEDKFFKGDKVIQISNNYKALDIDGKETEIYNGNTGVIIDVNFKNLIVDFGKNKFIVYEKSDLNQLELGYCTSIHKSQGDSAKQVVVIAPKAHTFMLNSNLLYVGVTRAKERCFLLGNIITINRAIKKKENLQRDTSLKEMIQNNLR